MTGISFEFFPPPNEQARSELLDNAEALAQFEPDFVSVTYGAGGTNQDRTLATLSDLAEILSVPVAGHLTTVSASIPAVQDVIDRYVDIGVEHIVALRGDLPTTDSSGSGAEPGYETAADLVAGIRRRPDGNRFQISVAAYPEVHPKATSPQSDLDSLKAKVDAGADQVITQFFFDTDVYLAFVDRAQAAGIEVPILPGIMPITNFKGITRFAERCGTTIPDWMSLLLADLDGDPEVQQLVAATIAAEQCRRLADAGADRFHFYTMNRRQLTSATCRTLDLSRLLGSPNSQNATEPTTNTAQTPDTGPRPPRHGPQTQPRSQTRPNPWTRLNAPRRRLNAPRRWRLRYTNESSSSMAPWAPASRTFG